MEVSTLFKIDEIDIKILCELRINSRRSIRQFANAIGESHSTVYNRINRLESAGIIKKWTVALDYSLLNLDVIFYVAISVKYEGSEASSAKFNFLQICDVITQLKGVCELNLINGEYDILAKVRTNSLQTSAEIILDHIRCIPGVVKVVSNHCYQTILEECDIDSIDFHQVQIDIKNRGNMKIGNKNYVDFFDKN